jgi:hypothetical protein
LNALSFSWALRRPTARAHRLQFAVERGQRIFANRFVGGRRGIVVALAGLSAAGRGRAARALRSRSTAQQPFGRLGDAADRFAPMPAIAQVRPGP